MAGAAMGSLPPVLEAMASAQVDILIWAAIGVAFAWRPARGAGLAFVAIVKIFSGWALAVWAVRDRRVIPGAAAVSAVALLSCLAVLGPGRTVSETRVWITRVAPTLAQGQRDGRARASQTLLGRPVSETLPANFSVAFFPVWATERLGIWTYPGEGNLPAPARLWLMVCSFGAPLLAIVLTRRLPPDEQAAWVLVVALLAGPLVRPTYVPAVLPAILVIRKHRRSPSLSGSPGRHGTPDRKASARLE
jgi:hypothetical protein